MSLVENQFVEQMLGRKISLFSDDLSNSSALIKEKLAGSRVLVIGACGSIGSAVVEKLADYELAALICVDISENNLVELVRRLRSKRSLSARELQTLCLDASSTEFDCFLESQLPFDFVLNLSAMKHVRSERDPYTLMRMISLNTVSTTSIFSKLSESIESYFAVSTDKATRPQNLMGASKRLMEILLAASEHKGKVSFARFANVAFSDGSLLHGFRNRIQLCQPLSAPVDIRRYFISAKEAAQICLIASVRIRDAKILTPVIAEPASQSFSDIGVMYLEAMGKVPVIFDSEEEAKKFPIDSVSQKSWPIYCFNSQTTGEKPIEEFYTQDDTVDLDTFRRLAVVSQPHRGDARVPTLSEVSKSLDTLKSHRSWTKSELVVLMKKWVPELHHEELNVNLDQKM